MSIPDQSHRLWDVFKLTRYPRLETETTPEGRAELESIARRLRKVWAEWQGEDCLHETAFGELDLDPL